MLWLSRTANRVGGIDTLFTSMTSTITGFWRLPPKSESVASWMSDTRRTLITRPSDNRSDGIGCSPLHQTRRYTLRLCTLPTLTTVAPHSGNIGRALVGYPDT